MNCHKYMSTIMPDCETGFQMSADLASFYVPFRDPQKFHEMLINFFEPYTKFSTLEPRVGIECIRLSQERFSPYLQVTYLARMYLDAIFAVIEIFRLTDGDVIRNTIEEYFLRTLHHKGVLQERNPGPPSLLRKFPKSSIHYGMTLSSGEYTKPFSIDSFLYHPDLLRSSDIRMLLRYGVPFEMDDNIVRSFEKDILKYILSYIRLADITTEEEEGILARLNDCYRTNGEKRRLYFILIQIFTVYLKAKGKIERWYSDIIESLRVIFLSIPDPLIKVTDIDRFLEVALRAKNTERNISDFRKLFLEMFPTSGGPVQPRSLKHLCRCQIRECLRQSMKLPHGVWSLEIPKNLQNFILMQQSEDEYYSDYVKDLVPEKSSSDDSHVEETKDISRSNV